jgi:hypothetical protein
MHLCQRKHFFKASQCTRHTEFKDNLKHLFPDVSFPSSEIKEIGQLREDRGSQSYFLHESCVSRRVSFQGRERERERKREREREREKREGERERGGERKR